MYMYLRCVCQNKNDDITTLLLMHNQLNTYCLAAGSGTGLVGVVVFEIKDGVALMSEVGHEIFYGCQTEKNISTIHLSSHQHYYALTSYVIRAPLCEQRHDFERHERLIMDIFVLLVLQMNIRQVTLSHLAEVRCFVFHADFTHLYLGDDSGVITSLNISPEQVTHHLTQHINSCIDISAFFVFECLRVIFCI